MTGEPVGPTTDNLKSAIAGETYEYTEMYPGFAKTARDEGFDEIAEWLETLARAEKSHAGRFTPGPRVGLLTPVAPSIATRRPRGIGPGPSARRRRRGGRHAEAHRTTTSWTCASTSASATQFRAEIIEMKKARRIALGDLMTIVFENTDTMRFQIQEMARAERMLRDEQIAHEVETYNELIPERRPALEHAVHRDQRRRRRCAYWLPRLVEHRGPRA